MTGVELIAGALAAGATAGVTDMTSAAVRDAYTGLRDRLRQRLTSRGQAREDLETSEGDVDTLQDRLGAALIATGADRDEEILTLAHQVLAGLDPVGEQAGKYQVDLRGAKGVIVGDNATMHIGEIS